jgi:hypothetical protein
LKFLFLTLFFPSVFFFDGSSYQRFLKKEMHVHIPLYKRKREPCFFDEAFTLPSSLGTSWLLSAQKLKEREREQPAGSALAKDVPSSSLMNPIRLPHPLSNPAEPSPEFATFCQTDCFVFHKIYRSSVFAQKEELLQSHEE